MEQPRAESLRFFDPRGGGSDCVSNTNPHLEFPPTLLQNVPSYPGYLADQLGRIWSSRSGQLRLLKPYVSRHKKGYPQVSIRLPSGLWRHVKVHKLLGVEC